MLLIKMSGSLAQIPPKMQTILETSVWKTTCFKGRFALILILVVMLPEQFKQHYCPKTSNDITFNGNTYLLPLLQNKNKQFSNVWYVLTPFNCIFINMLFLQIHNNLSGDIFFHFYEQISCRLSILEVFFHQPLFSNLFNAIQH